MPNIYIKLWPIKPNFIIQGFKKSLIIISHFPSIIVHTHLKISKWETVHL